MRNTSNTTGLRNIQRSLVVFMLFVVFGVTGYATLGDGKSKKKSSKKSFLSNRTQTAGTFSLKSGYSFRGNMVVNTNSEMKYINLNSTITKQKGNITYTVPLKKKVILPRVKIELGNRQLKRN